MANNRLLYLHWNWSLFHDANEERRNRQWSISVVIIIVNSTIPQIVQSTLHSQHYELILFSLIELQLESTTKIIFKGWEDRTQEYWKESIPSPSLEHKTRCSIASKLLVRHKRIHKKDYSLKKMCQHFSSQWRCDINKICQILQRRYVKYIEEHASKYIKVKYVKEDASNSLHQMHQIWYAKYGKHNRLKYLHQQT